ncbi:MAG: patatin-like phospholipase family protein [Lewinellaceae bacterium]|nr:patatin-like phospholipase family protein [Lewinellaceae bacterium]
METIKNLVFQGGGVKGLAYVGALQELDKQGIYAQVEGVAGTSAGSIVSALVSLRYSVGEINTIMQGTNMASFMDRENLLKKLKYFGLHPGDAFLNWIKKQIRQSPLKVADTVTFQQLKDKGARDLHVYATDLFTRNICHFSAETTPNAIVAEAVRASMSIPVFFNAWKFSNNIPTDHIYVDGGVLLNFPLFTFDDMGMPPKSTLGFELANLTGKQVLHSFKYWHWGEFVKNTFETLLMAQVVDLSSDEKELNRVIRINDLGISATDFDLTDEQKQELVQSGWDATKKHFGRA